MDYFFSSLSCALSYFFKEFKKLLLSFPVSNPVPTSKDMAWNFSPDTITLFYIEELLL